MIIYEQGDSEMFDFEWSEQEQYNSSTTENQREGSIYYVTKDN